MSPDPADRDAALDRAVERALASYDLPTAVERRLHAVPPHAVYEVAFDGERAVCKVAPGATGDASNGDADPRVEAAVLAFLDEHTRVPGPRVLAVGDDHYVATWCDGLPGEPELDEPRLRAMGAGLARLHADAASHFDAPGSLRVVEDGALHVGEDGALHVDDDGAPHVDDGALAVDVAARWSDVLRDLLEDCRPALAALGHEPLLDDVLAFVRDHAERFDAADDATLLHGNYLPDHVGLDRPVDAASPAESVTCVIDPEHALVGPGEYDLVRTATPTVGPPWLDPGDDWATLREAYEAVRPLPAGVEQRFALHGAVDAIRYLRALHVQRGPLDASHAVARRARELRGHAEHALAAARDAVE